VQEAATTARAVRLIDVGLTGLDLSITQEGDQSTDEVAIRRTRRVAVGDVELVLGRSDHLAQGEACEIDAAVTLEDSEHPLHVPFRALLACYGEDPSELLPLLGGALAQGVNEHEGALSLPDVPEDLLAVPALVADQVQDVVLNLERRAEQEAEQVEACCVDRACRPDQCPDPAGVDGRVPAGLPEDHPQVVVLSQVEDVVARPPELQRLALDRLEDEVLRLVEDPVREVGTQDEDVLDQRADG
jgi:hypothetical protein